MQHHSKAKLEGAGAPLSRILPYFPPLLFHSFLYSSLSYFSLLPLLLLLSPPVPFPLILLYPLHKRGFPFFPRVE